MVQVGSLVASTTRWPFGVRQGDRLRKVLPGRSRTSRRGTGPSRGREGGGLRSTRVFSTRCTVARYASLLIPRERISRIPRYSKDSFVIGEVIGSQRARTSTSSETYLAQDEDAPSRSRSETAPKRRPCRTSLGILERPTSSGRPSVKTSRSLAESGSNKWSSSRGEIAAVHRRPRTASLVVSDAGHPWRKKKRKKEEEARTKARQRK